MQKHKRQKLIHSLALKVRKEKEPIKCKKFTVYTSTKNLKKEYGKNKNIPKEYEKQILIALSFYPELKEEKISFIVTKAIFSMETQLKISTIFSKKRHYIIKMNKNKLFLYFNKLSPETVISLLCHELSHVVDYKKKSAIGMAIFGVKYVVPSTRRKIEFETDLRSMFHGTGHLMTIHHEEYMNNIESIAKRKMFRNFARKYRENYYLNSKEIKELMITHNLVSKKINHKKITKK